MDCFQNVPITVSQNTHGDFLSGELPMPLVSVGGGTH